MEDLPQIPILALGHTSRAGKDTAAAAIVDAIRGAERVAFASRLKATCVQLFGSYGLREESYYDAHPEKRRELLPGVGKSPVQLWIEVGRKMREVYPDLWVDLALGITRLNPIKLLVVSDLRFPNEAEAIRARGGWCVKVERPGVELLGSDDEFSPDFQWDAVIRNDKTVEKLQEKAVGVARFYLGASSRSSSSGPRVSA